MREVLVRFKQLLLIALAAALLIIGTQCTDKYPAKEHNSQWADNNGCVSCHTNADLLKQVAEPLPAVNGEAGEG